MTYEKLDFVVDGGDDAGDAGLRDNCGDFLVEELERVLQGSRGVARGLVGALEHEPKKKIRPEVKRLT